MALHLQPTKMATIAKNLLLTVLILVQKIIQYQILQGKRLISWIHRRRVYRQRLGTLIGSTNSKEIGQETHSGLKKLFYKKQSQDRRRISRSIWVKPRSEVWWDIFKVSTDDRSWIEHFRMSLATFEFLVASVKPYLERHDTNFRKAIPLRKRVAVAVWRLATGSDYRSIQELFGISRSTACVIVQEFITAVTVTLKDVYLHHPTPTELRTIIQGFRDKWGFPQCAGSIDATHIPIIAPSEHRNDYYNRKGWYSVICQAVVDSHYMFWSLECGFPGRCHDARMFSNSTVFQMGQAGTLFPAITEDFNGVEVPICIISDPAYPIQPWLLKPYKETAQTTDQQRYFNYRLSRARMTVECAFGRLKGRWRCIMKRNDNHIALVPTMVLCCAILHNMCERRGELYVETSDSNDTLPQPPRSILDPPRGEVMAQASEIRDALCEYFNAN